LPSDTTGTVNATSRSYIGGSIGYDQNAVRDKSSVYWGLDTSGVPDISKGAGNIAFDPGLKGTTDRNLKRGLPKGFDPNILGAVAEHQQRLSVSARQPAAVTGSLVQ
jgi:hypothetical protein